MQILKTDLHHPSQAILDQTIQALKQGSVVIHPTETCYGFAVDIFQEQALQSLYAVKKMALDKPVSMMVTSLAEAQQYAEFDPLAFKIAEKFWPGAVTLILPRKKTLPDFFNKDHLTVGIRCPDSKIAQALIKGVGRPLSTTSANVSGEPEVYEVKHFLDQLDLVGDKDAQGLAVILDVGAIAKNPPSTLIVFEQGKPVFLREGALLAEVKNFLEIS